MGKKIPLRHRILSKCAPDENGCLVFMGSRIRRGYGSIRNEQGKMENAHRVMYRLSKGPIPPGHVVMHSCDNPPCVLEEHLVLGTQKDNVADMIAKGRWAKTHKGNQQGENNNSAKLTQSVVRTIRELYAEGLSQREIARRTGVHYANVWHIVHEKSWKE